MCCHVVSLLIPDHHTTGWPHMILEHQNNSQLLCYPVSDIQCSTRRRREIRAKLSSDDFLREVFEVVRKNEGANRDICFSGRKIIAIRWELLVTPRISVSGVGIVVNMMTDCKYRHFFRTLHGLPICLRMLGEAKKSCDWALASLICQVTNNCSAFSQSFPGDGVIYISISLPGPVELLHRLSELNRGLRRGRGIRAGEGSYHSPRYRSGGGGQLRR